VIQAPLAQPVQPAILAQQDQQAQPAQPVILAQQGQQAQRAQLDQQAQQVLQAKMVNRLVSMIIWQTQP
jgi:hypothetical protein